MHLGDSKRAGIHIWDFWSFWMEQSIWVFTCVATGNNQTNARCVHPADPGSKSDDKVKHLADEQMMLRLHVHYNQKIKICSSMQM